MKHSLLTTIPLATLLLGSAAAADQPLAQRSGDVQLGEIVVEETSGSSASSGNYYTSPSTTITEEDARGINTSTIDDFIKYEPSLVVRRRYIGDPNGTLGIRGSNMFQTTRAMVFADGLPLHYLLQSRYSGAPRWSLVSPDETESVEVIYGPFSAEYGGNAMGGVVNIKTKLPTERVFHAEAGVFSQDFKFLGTNETYNGHREYISFGDRYDDLSVYVFHNHLQNDSQPMTFRYGSVLAPGAGSAVTGAIKDSDSVGAPAIYYGDTGTSEVTTDLTKLKLGYEFGDWVARFTMAYEDRDSNNDSPNNYLQDAGGNPFWDGAATYNGDSFSVRGSHFAVSEQNRETLLLGFGLEGAPTGSDWLVDANFSYFDVLDDMTLSSNRNPADPAFDGSGRVNEYDDTGWVTLDLKTRTHRFMDRDDMNFSTGYHYNHYSLNINSHNSDDYAAAVKTSQRSSTGGDTMMHAVFAQWGWDFAPLWDVALGARYEQWRSKDGHYYNYTSNDLQDHADRKETGTSPKFSLGFKPNSVWNYRYSLARAYRFPIVEELYRNEFTTQGTTIADADLKPEKGIHQNFMIERQIPQGFMRVNLFHEIIKDVIFNQRIVSPSVSTFLPIDEVTTRGIEFIVQQDRVFDTNTDVRFNVNYVDSEITKHSANTSVEGNRFPRMPKWRSNLLLTHQVNERWDASAGVRYASDSFGRLDNADDVDEVMGGQDSYLFLDLKTSYKITKDAKLSFGIDNVTNDIAFVHHPWPQRTYHLEAAVTF